MYVLKNWITTGTGYALASLINTGPWYELAALSLPGTVLATYLFLQCCGSGAFLTPGSGVQDPGWVKGQDPGSGSGIRIRDTDPGSGSRMNNPDHVS